MGDQQRSRAASSLTTGSATSRHLKNGKTATTTLNTHQTSKDVLTPPHIYTMAHIARQSCFVSPLSVLHARKLTHTNWCNTRTIRYTIPRRSRALAPCCTTQILEDRDVSVGDVQVRLRVERLDARRRLISGGVDIAESAKRIWQVLTSYHRNKDYIPNIVESTVERGPEGVILEQVGTISRRLRLRSRMLMRVSEHRDEWRIVFSCIKARDFTEFEGRYTIVDGDHGCRLEYAVTAAALPIYPVTLVERKVCKEVPGMLAAIRKEAMEGNCIPF